jgi:nitrogen fixation/metabolism regulation signal transduction histidine kinase
MGFRRFRVECLARIALIGGTVFLAFFLATRPNLYVTTGLVFAAALVQAWLLFRYVETGQRNLLRFLESVKYADLSCSFDPGDPSAGELNKAFNDVLDRFRQVHAEREDRHRYLQTVMHHVEAGLIVFDSEGAVELANTAAERLLGIPHIRHIGELAPLHPGLAEVLPYLGPGERRLIPVENDGERHQLAIHSASFILRGKQLTLASLHDIRSELEEKEMESWQNLIRVLTHEIMNSITPIASLASTADQLLEGVASPGEAPDPETLGDIRGAVRTIEQRSRGLLHFVENYRRLTRIPKPKFTVFPVGEMFERVERLMSGRIGDAGIRLETIIEPEGVELTADPDLLEQVLINLVQNSVQVLAGKPDGKITLHAGVDDQGRVFIRVGDNGPGIMEDVLEKIFVPFFTTRRDGSGIGLSLSRQIMRLHRGTITVRSEPNVETVFTLRF